MAAFQKLLFVNYLYCLLSLWYIIYDDELILPINRHVYSRLFQRTADGNKAITGEDVYTAIVKLF